MVRLWKLRKESIRPLGKLIHFRDREERKRLPFHGHLELRLGGSVAAFVGPVSAGLRRCWLLWFAGIFPECDNCWGQTLYARYAFAMKQETATPTDRLRVLLKMYALALLLAMFISALHAGILFSIGDFNELVLHWARPILGKGRPTDILVVLATIAGLFVAHIAEASMWAAFFWKWGHLASSAKAGISPVVRTRRSVTVMSCSRNRGKASGRSVRSTGCSPLDVPQPLSSWCCKMSGTTSWPPRETPQINPSLRLGRLG